MADPQVRISIILDAARAQASAAELGAKLTAALGPTLNEKIAAAEGRMKSLFSTSLFSGAATGLGRVVDGFGRLGLALAGIERFGRVLDAALVAPFARLVTGIAEATSSYRRFESFIGGTVGGGLAGGKRVDDELLRRTLGSASPYSVSDVQDSVRQLAITPGLSSRLAFGDTKQIADATDAWTKLVDKLSIISNLDTSAVAEAVRLAAEGDTRSLRRLRLSPAEVAAAGGNLPSQLTGRPEAIIGNLATLADSIIPDSTLKEFGNLWGKKVEKLHDVFTKALRDIGEAGTGGAFYDKLTARLGGITDAVVRYLDGPEWGRVSTSIADHLDSILGSISRSALNFFNALAGIDGKNVGETPEAVGNVVDALLGKVDDFAKKLPQLGTAAGNALNHLGDTFGVFVDKLGELAGMVLDNPLVRTVAELSGPTTAEDVSILQEKRDEKTLDLYGQLGIRGAGLRLQTDWSGVETETAYQAWHREKFNSYGNANSEAERTGVPADLVAAHSFQSLDISNVAVQNDRTAADLAQKVKALVDGMNGYTLADDGRVTRALKAAGINLSPIQTPAASRPREYSPATNETIENITGGIGKDIIGIGDKGDPFGPKFRSVMDAINRISDADPEKIDPYRKITGNVNGALGTLANGFTFPGEGAGAGGNLLSKIKASRDQLIGRIDDSIDQYLDAAADEFDPAKLLTIQNDVATLDAIRAKVEQSFAARMAKVNAAIVNKLGAADVAMVESLKSDAPAARSQLIDNILSGNTSGARTAAGLTGLDASSFGASAIPLDLLTKVRREQEAAHVAQIQEQGNFDFAPKRTIDQNLISYYSGALQDARGDMQRAQAAFVQSGSDGDYRTFQNDIELVGQLTAKLRDLRLETNTTLQDFIKFGDEVQTAMERGLGDTLTSLIEGTGKLSDVLKGLAHSIISAFSNSFAHTLISSIPGVGAGNDNGRSGIGGLLGRLFGLGGASTSSDAGSGFGGGAGSDFDVLPHLAQGGIVSKETALVAGEAGREAIIPLDRGLPKELAGGDTHMHVVIVNDAKELWAKGADADFIINAISGDFRKGGRAFKSMRAKP